MFDKNEEAAADLVQPPLDQVEQRHSEGRAEDGIRAIPVADPAQNALQPILKNVNAPLTTKR
jgi:hypothetical protein